jgi:hypothetical protein
MEWVSGFQRLTDDDRAEAVYLVEFRLPAD